MPIFAFQAVRDPGKVETGDIEANDSSTATAMLIKKGFHILNLEDIEERGSYAQTRYHLGGVGGLRLRDLVRTTRDIASLLKAGLPLVAALNKLHGRALNTRWNEISDGLRARIADGLTLSQALSAYPRVFDSMFVNLVKTGEETGRLSEVLTRLANLKEKEEELRARVKMALVYPSVMVVLGFLTVFGLVTFIVPTFVEVFRDTGQILPLPTRTLVALSSFLSRWRWPLIAGIVCFTFLSQKYFRSERGKRTMGTVILHLPLLGSLSSMAQIAAFSRTMATLIGNGLPVIKAIQISSQTLSNPLFAEAVERIHGKLREGHSVSQGLEKEPLFPEMVASMVAVGEESGSVDQSFGQIAEEYEEEVDRKVKIVMTLLEPMMILLIGGMVGFIVMALILPIFEMGETIRF